MSVETVAAIVFAIACAGVIAFQVGLAGGAPWGAYAMGGRYPGRFPPPMRVAAIVQAILLTLLAVAVLWDARVVLGDAGPAPSWLVWVAVAFSAVSVVLNAITRSAVERRLWLPVAVVMLVASLAVALS